MSQQQQSAQGVTIHGDINVNDKISGVVKNSTQNSTSIDLSTPAEDSLPPVKVSSSSYFWLFKFCILPSRKYTSILIFAIIFSIGCGAPLPAIGVLFGKLINEFPPPEDALRQRLTQLLAVATAYFAATWIWTICWGLIGEKIGRTLREKALARFLLMDLEYFELEAPDVSSHLTSDILSIQHGSSEKIGLVLQGYSYLIASFVAGFALNAKLTGILLAGIIPALGLVITFGGGAVAKYERISRERTAEASKTAEEALTNIAVVQSYCAQEEMARKHEEALKGGVRSGIWKAVWGGLMHGGAFLIAYSAYALAFWEGKTLVRNGEIHIDQGAGTVFTIIFLILDSSLVVGRVTPMINCIAVAGAAAGRLRRIIKHAPPKIDVEDEDPQLELPPPVFTALEFSNVSFVYPTRPSLPILTNVNLRFRAGTHTAIVGESGSGKSTIASLIMRFYDPTSGEIRLNDSHPLRNIRLQNYRQRVGLVQQDPILFSGTVLENISHGIPADVMAALSPGEVRAKCEQAARDANAYDFIMALPHGLDTIISGQRTTSNLSGGQKQRISIARAIVGDQELLVLDEPTAKLDSGSEKVVMNALEHIASGGRGKRTIITIAHRLATIKDADWIIVMAKGNVVEQGTHAELMAKEGGIYRGMVTAQNASAAADRRGKIRVVKPDSDSEGVEGTYIEKNGTIVDAEVASISSEDPKERMSMWNMLFRTLTYGENNLLYSIIALTASLAAGAIIIAEAMLFGHLLYNFTNPGTDGNLPQDTINLLALGFFLAALLALAAYAISGIFFGLVSGSLVFSMRNHFLRTIMNKPIEFFSLPRHTPFHLLNALNSDVASLGSLSGVIIGAVVSSSISLLGGVGLGLGYSWRIGAVLLPAVPLVVGAGFARLRILGKLEEMQEKGYEDGIALALEHCNALMTVCALGRQREVVDEFKQRANFSYKRNAVFLVHSGAWFALAIALPYFAYALAYWWGSRNVREGYATALEFFVVLPALLNSAQSSGRIFSLAPEFTRAKKGAERIFALLEGNDSSLMQQQPPPSLASLVSNKETQAPGGTEKSGAPKGAPLVQFNNVSFTYPTVPPTNRQTLRNLTLAFTPGTFTGIVGPSGSGKSSIISLLNRFYTPTSGAITLTQPSPNAVPEAYTNLSLASYRSIISYVPQDPGILSATIWSNLLLGFPSAPPTPEVCPVPLLAQIQSLLSILDLCPLITSLPQGLLTPCGPGGTLLSGGQRQRLAIARALIKPNASILLLDEATSALDAHTELRVQEAVRGWLAEVPGRSVIAVAHRISMVREADRILVVEEGEVVESGTHAELVRIDGGRYREMVKLQEMGSE